MSDPTDLLSAGTGMGAVTLRVADLDGMADFYRDAITLHTLQEEVGRITLGRLKIPIVTLEHAPELKHAASRQAGLYHVAIVFPTKADLAAAVYSTARRNPGSFTGSTDHLVSNAFYFTDPEGNGIELYWDFPRTQWQYTGGNILMGADPLDPNAFLKMNLTEHALTTTTAAAARVGHVHLSVGDIPTAHDFYATTLGFEVTANLGSALFVSAGNYHHHIGMNVWNSAHAGRRQPALGLGQLRIDVANPDELDTLQDRLTHKSIQTANNGRTLTFEDPWANHIEVGLIREQRR